jgi:hypothetical protein
MMNQLCQDFLVATATISLSDSAYPTLEVRTNFRCAMFNRMIVKALGALELLQFDTSFWLCYSI